ncbi:iron complex transport system ATP-binding protein [Frankia sp. AiPs1]|uniref:ABC transporter ATP-binding protein n=1 Tax=Frankia sp. AiPa1 TaxID=573492 RepID=UPI00202B703A|nr:ABC transporter ATP-binding protein [Frankia sp. AiPa1]MCL9760449.1 ABC transporter ATP-binding protein [Frankia sp. AiPa1]
MALTGRTRTSENGNGETHPDQSAPGLPAASSTDTPQVEVSGLSFGYGRNGHRIVDVSLTVHAAEVCCLLGPNGAGKTTLLRCLLGLLRPHGGTVRLAGRDLTDLTPRELARRVAYVPQSTSSPFPFTALDIAVMGRTPHLGLLEAPNATDRRGALEQLDRLGIAHLAERSFAALSGGERQLVLLARALVQQAGILILDEPTAALDYGNEVRTLLVVAELAREGHCIIMTTHQPSHALTYSNRAVLMRAGAVIADGHPDDVVTGERLSDLYGVPVHVTGVSLPPGHGRAEIRTCVPIPGPSGIAPSGTAPSGIAQAGPAPTAPPPRSGR